MSQRKLLEAARALRLGRHGSSAQASATEARVVARVGAQYHRTRRARRLRWLLPLSAALIIASIWAATEPSVQREARAIWLRFTSLGATPPPSSDPERPVGLRSPARNPFESSA